MNNYDYLIIGSGLNSLVCAALLGKQGKKVCVLERDPQPGGCIKVDRETAPGFTFDLMSTSHVQFVTSPAYRELREELEAAGLEYCTNRYPVGGMLPDGRSLILGTDHQQNLESIAAVSPEDAQSYAASLDSFVQNSDIIFNLLGNEPFSLKNAGMLCRETWRRGVSGMVSVFRDLIKPARQQLELNYRSDEMKALLAPICLHGGLSPDASMSSLMAELITFSFAQVSDPLVKGGSDNLIKAFKTLIESNQGAVVTDRHVSKIITRDNRAVGIQTADGEEYMANRGVIANVTPGQLYQNLLSSEVVPDKVAQQTAGFRHGRSCMIIHLALDKQPDWLDPDMSQVALMHVCDGLDSISKAVSEADQGLLPDRGTICVVQPVAVDPSRAPQGKWILWLQILELPKLIKGDARNEIPIPEDGAWNAAVSEQYADRIVDLLAEVVPGLKESVIARRVLSPADLERLNINLVGGDPYSGHCGIEQSMMFRPLPAVKNHRTPVKQLYHIGASTHPGPGLGGMSGYLLAKSLG